MLLGCDSSDNIQVQNVDDNQRLSDVELQKIQKQSFPAVTGIYKFGFDLRASPQEDTAQYLPFLDYLKQATGYQFKLHFTPRGSTAADELGLNHTQFASIGATSFLYAQTRFNAITLVRGLNPQGKAEYQSVFVVAPDSDISSISDFIGRKLAFGSMDSTQGHLIPRIMLNDHNINLQALNNYQYTGSHQNCAEAVVSKKVDICGMQDQLAKKLQDEGKVKIIHSSRYYPSSGIAANKDVPSEVREKVKQALLDFDPIGADSATMYHWERTEMPKGFTDSKDGDYAELRQWSIKLGFLPEPETAVSEEKQ
ncbi:phosphate/phosphite/phosphonate ABC transporter substrate-binding protein [sulfur-oxidizing endosymbiont of Gigantopelta aegis]|uniref:phosphate/phosphite/phosphonate ABC transporter substrate-binding protein n=1 Tax=sulfur-oxidizing endosymbiont of Gigantopelta aegis TaxID=2794934 RepID=UPI0018DCBD87|nr:phosphate/phosphite/phosphonate ABC transporter substrate-binding protein [sulfur-oxidizing endosymbiont of Gigantopelta aegis]